MFGSDPSDTRARIKVCCGPRCGTVPDHRAIYAAIERAADDSLVVVPTLCQGLCPGGVTVVLPGGVKTKIAAALEAVACTSALALPVVP